MTLTGEQQRVSTEQRVSTDKSAARTRRWALPAALALAAGAVGGAIGYAVPPLYTAETRLAVGPETFAAQSVPGFASAAATLASNYARYMVDTDDGAAEIEQELGLEPGSVADVSASPIPESNIVRIEATASSRDDALAAAALAADTLIAEVNSPPAESEANLERLLATSQELSAHEQEVSALEAALAAEGRTGTPASQEAARERLVEAQGRLRVAQVEQSVAEEIYRNQYQRGVTTASVSQVREETITGSTRGQNAQWGGLAGLALGGLVGAAMTRPSARRSAARPSSAPIEQVAAR